MSTDCRPWRDDAPLDLPIRMRERPSSWRPLHGGSPGNQVRSSIVRDLEALSADDFTALRGDRFQVAPDDAAPFEVELVEVTELAREPGGRAPFSIVFQGGPSPPVPQRIYRVEHEQLGAIEIFLVPIAPDRYEAIFT
jgi:hypothetical protein